MMEKVQYPYPIDTYSVSTAKLFLMVTEDEMNYCTGKYQEGVDPSLVEAQRKLIKHAIGREKRFYYSYTRDIFYVEGL